MWQECVVNSEVLNHFVQSNTIFTLNVHYCDTMWQEKSVFSKVAREECVVKCEVQSPA